MHPLRQAQPTIQASSDTRPSTTPTNQPTSRAAHQSSQLSVEKQRTDTNDEQRTRMSVAAIKGATQRPRPPQWINQTRTSKQRTQAQLADPELNGRTELNERISSPQKRATRTNSTAQRHVHATHTNTNTTGQDRVPEVTGMGPGAAATGTARTILSRRERRPRRAHKRTGYNELLVQR